MKFFLIPILCAFIGMGCFSSLAITSDIDQKWAGPTSGPKAIPLRYVIYIASDFKNGGVTAVYRSFAKAARKLKWKVRIKDGMDDKKVQARILSDAIAERPNGIIISGFQADQFPDLIAAAKEAKISLVGWHSDKQAGPSNNLFANVSTNATDVAKLAVEFVIQDAKKNQKKVGVIIFNDNQYEIAKLKKNTMIDEINKCTGHKNCQVLSVENIPISEAYRRIPTLIPKLNKKYGSDWTYSLAINDVYFDSIHFPLRKNKRTDIILVSAGDGAPMAINRIKSGTSQQKATIAEPLGMQGFQLADELNRAFSNQPPSGYISRPQVITTESLNSTKNQTQKDILDYESSYYSIWEGKSKK